MSDLVKLENNIPVTTTIIISEGTDNDHASVIKLVRTYQADFEEFGRVGFEIQPFATPGGMQSREIALLNEQQATLLITYMRNSEIVREFKKRLVKAFYELKQAAQPPELQIAHALILANKMIEDNRELIAVMQPKADFYDAVTGSPTAIDMARVAKVLDMGIGRNNLFEFLRDHKILQENNTPYQKYVDSGYFRLIESKFNKPDGSINISCKTVVYQKGVDFIRRKLESAGFGQREAA